MNFVESISQENLNKEKLEKEKRQAAHLKYVMSEFGENFKKSFTDTIKQSAIKGEKCHKCYLSTNIGINYWMEDLSDAEISFVPVDFIDKMNSVNTNELYNIVKPDCSAYANSADHETVKSLYRYIKYLDIRDFRFNERKGIMKPSKRNINIIYGIVVYEQDEIKIFIDEIKSILDELGFSNPIVEIRNIDYTLYSFKVKEVSKGFWERITHYYRKYKVEGKERANVLYIEVNW